MSNDQRRTNQGASLDEQPPFLFLGGNLALDLVNTEIRVRGKKRDLLVRSDDASRWWKNVQHIHVQDSYDTIVAEWREEHLDGLRALRRTLRHLFETLAAHRHVHEDDMEELNTLLHKGSYTLTVTPEGNMDARYQLRHSQEHTVLLAIAFAALRLITEQDLNRLHACQNSKCTLLFYDTTKSATRQWCSVECTNRVRSAQHYKQAQRKKEEKRTSNAMVSL